jgi:hypothetical protein
MAIDADTGEPVPSAQIKIGSTFPERKATADASGIFTLIADLPHTWRELLLEGTRDGYELQHGHVVPSTTLGVRIRMLPSITIRAGESLKTRIYPFGFNCFDEGWPCRRIIVDAPSGELVDVEVTASDIGAEIGVEGPRRSHPLAPPLRRTITVPGGEIWIYGGIVAPFTEVTVTARRALTALALPHRLSQQG